jgi:hypothetical protein
MLRFKQFISETPIIDDFAAQDTPLHRLDSDALFHDRMFAVRRTEKESGKQHKPFARIGSYTLHHASPSASWGEHSILVKHGKNPVGHLSVKIRKGSRLGDMELDQHLDATEMPRFLRAHTGSRAKVPHLASRVYMQVAKHFGMPIVSGGQQTPGGQSVWHGIAKLGTVSAINADTRKHIEKYNPEQHAAEVYDPEHGRGANWSLVYNPKHK